MLHHYEVDRSFVIITLIKAASLLVNYPRVGQMRKQHNANSDGSRKCWATARERNRMKARFAIRQRVLVPGERSFNVEMVRSQSEEENSSRKQQIQEILHRIIQGDRSFFSLQYMEGHFALINESFPAIFVWDDASNECGRLGLLGEQKLLSRFGKDGLENIERYLSALNTCTFFEYALSLKRYHVIGSLILGGIDPCVGSTFQTQLMSDVSMGDRLEAIGTLVRQRFFSGVVPLTLSSYIIKRVVDLRRFAWEIQSRAGSEDPTVLECEICLCKTFSVRLLSFADKDDEVRCRHRFCEPCLWKNIIDHMDDRHGDVVVCPVCNTVAIDSHLEDNFLGTEATEDFSISTIRCQKSLDKYLKLPTDSNDMKKSKLKKRVVQEREMLCATWSEAVKPSLGLTQSVRRDKFFIFVEKGSYHYVKGCLASGVDLALKNEYGQTALFIAVWRGSIQLARLLLHYGSDPQIPANGGITPLSVALASGNDELLNLVRRACVEDHFCSIYDRGLHVPLWNFNHRDALILSSLRVTILIDWSSDRPAAGSFILDDFMASHTVDSLIELWKTLPTDFTTKKNGPCSVRSYYCDAHAWVTQMIRASLIEAFGCSEDDEQGKFSVVSVYPHMRFLCYSKRGAVLPPHVDLSRLDFFCHKRSTHSFLLYLTDCQQGGETALIGAVAGDGREVVHALVKPRRGRLLLFPHRCPHEGITVEDVPKLLVRGEVRLYPSDPEQL